MRAVMLNEDIVDPSKFGKHKKNKDPETQILDVPLITVNNLVFRSRLEEETYKPVELLSYADIISHLKRESFRANKKTEDSTIPEQEKRNKLFLKKFHERKRQTAQVEEHTPPHPHPFNRNRRIEDQITAQTLKARSVLLELSDEVEGTEFPLEKHDTHSELEKKFENFMKWLTQAKQEYVAMETINSIEEFQILFKLLEKYTSPTLLQIKMNQNSTWTVVCQPLENFKRDYMVLRIGLKYCLCLEPF